MLEKILFKKVEVWLVLLLLLLFGIATTAFGTLAVQGDRAGLLGRAARQIAQFPMLVVELFENRNNHVSARQFPDKPAGFKFARPMHTGHYLLLNRYDGDIDFNVTEFIAEGATKPIVRWVYDDPARYAFEPRSGFNQEITSDPATMRAYHPWLNVDGGLLFHPVDLGR